MNRLSKLSILLVLVTLVSACAAPATPVPTQVLPTATVAPTHNLTATAAADNARQGTTVAATLTALPTATQPPTETLAPTETAVPATATTAPTATPVPPTKAAVATQAPASTQAPAATQAPATKSPPTGGSPYSTTGGGPAGYTSTLSCTQGDGTPCQSAMAPGDLIFGVTLESAADALEVIFYPFGLSVERDGANAADMYITADAGWLPPNSQARFGVSRKFSVPGHYVVRTNGCLYTQANWASGVCSWWTLNGTVVTFDIQ